jgi:hypothetical protein
MKFKSTKEPQLPKKALNETFKKGISSDKENNNEKAKFDKMRAEQHESAFKEKGKIVDRMLEISELIDLSIKPTPEFLAFIADPENKTHQESLKRISNGINDSLKERESDVKKQAELKATRKAGKEKKDDEVMPLLSEMDAYINAYENMVSSQGYSMIKYLMTNPPLSRCLSSNLNALKIINEAFNQYRADNLTSPTTRTFKR